MSDTPDTPPVTTPKKKYTDPPAFSGFIGGTGQVPESEPSVTTPLERIRAELDAASGTPWEVRHHEMPYKVPFEVAVHQYLGDTVVCWRQTDWQYDYPPQIEQIEADATLIANAPTYLAALLDVAEAAQEVAEPPPAGMVGPLSLIAALVKLDAALKALDEISKGDEG